MAAPDVEHQSFAIDHHHSLQEFVLPESLRYDTPFDNFAAENHFPVIDLADLDGTGSYEEVITKLVWAAKTWGFFKVVNHGVPHEVIQKIMAHMGKFFARPIEEKMRVKSNYPRDFEGYTPGTMMVDADGLNPCWSERINFEREGDALQALAEQVWREDDRQVRCMSSILGSNNFFTQGDDLIALWIDIVSPLGSSTFQIGRGHIPFRQVCPVDRCSFRIPLLSEVLLPTCFQWLRRSQDLMQYMDHMDSLSHRLIGLLSEAIAVDSSQKFKEVHDSTSGHFVAAHYPPCPRPDLARGLRIHTDPHTLSILYQEYPGLQLLKDGKWLSVKPEVGTLIVNVGDMLQIWSNGQYHSVQHRVALNSTMARFSLIFFKNPRLDEVISAPIELIDEEHPRIYKDVSFKEYLRLMKNRIFKTGLEKVTIA